MKRNIKPECTECGGTMVAGSVVDFRRNEAAPAEWVSGELSASFWTGGIKNEDRYGMGAYRCSDCGFLKVYAREKTPAKGWLG